MVLEQAPVEAEPVPDGSVDDETTAWVISGRTRDGLRAHAERLASAVDEDAAATATGIGWALATTRAALEHRAVLVGDRREQLLAGLAALAQGADEAGLSVGASGRAVLAFLFTGQGSQRVGMGRELYKRYPAFASAFDAVCAQMDRHLDARLRDVVFGEPGGENPAWLDQSGYAQAGLFALQVALFRLLEQAGVRPGFLLGHSVGELAAAHVAGVWSLADACAVVAARGRLMQALPGAGAMVAVETDEAEVARVLTGRDGELSVAAVNGPRSVVVSGVEAAVDEVARRFAGMGRRTRRLRVSHAFHSALMEPMLAEFAEVLSGVAFEAPVLPMVSAVTGRVVAAEELCAPDYWVRQVRATVRFADGVRTLAGNGITGFVELGPDGVLATMVGDCLDNDVDPDRVAVAPLLRAGQSEVRCLLSALAGVFVRGGSVDWSAVLPGSGSARVDLPTYAFQHQRYWPRPAVGTGDVAAAGLASPGHPLLGAWVRSATGKETLFTGRLSAAGHLWLTQHEVLGSVLLPGTAFVELALWVGERLGCDQLEELTLHAPLVLPERDAVLLQVVVAEADDNGRRSVDVYSRPEGSVEEPWTRHGSGVLAPAVADTPPVPDDGEVWPPRDAQPLALERHYDELALAGFTYGPAFQGLRRAWRRGDELFCEVELPAGVAPDATRFGIHPALLDAALHPLGQGGADGRVRLPFSWTGVRLHATGAAALRVRLQRREPSTVTLTATDVTGSPVVSVASLVLRPVSPEQLRPVSTALDDCLFRVDWVPVDPPAQSPAPSWACIAHDEVPADFYDAAARLPDVAALAATLDRGRSVPGTVVVVCPMGDASGADITAAAHAVAEWVLTAIQVWLADERLAGSRLAVVTRGGAAVRPGDPVVNLLHAPIAGLVRSAGMEHPDRISLVDVDAGCSARSLAEALHSGEPEVAVRQGRLYGRRLARMDPPGTLAAPAAAGHWRLTTAARGTLANLRLVAAPEVDRALARGQVRVDVRAAGVNFRDVLIALDMYPGEGDLGIEGAGVVSAVGPGVTGLAPGDRVMGMFDGAFGPVAVADHRTLVRVPEGWSFEQAASVPVAFITAYYSLCDLAGLRAGESVLIHAAAGGVGMAAVQLAAHLGAEVFGTASPPKWDALRRAGLDDRHMASSRDVAFADRIRETTGGRGVDVVLNSLTGAYIDASLDLLPRGGRFIEMGKADPRDPDGAMACHAGVRYRAFDLGEAGPDRIGEILTELLGLFERGALRPLPVACWDVRRAPEAFRSLSQAAIVGKAVLQVGRRFTANDAVLVTGGTGALGRVIARHLVTAHGLRHVVLAGRRPPAGADAEKLRTELAALGAEVELPRCDVRDERAVARVLDSIRVDHRLAGVVHAAGVIDDGVVASLDAGRLAEVLRPKLDGAWHLHRLTEHLDLDMFVLFSSAAGTLGGAGQGNYAAANTFLDALAEHRRAYGLPAAALAWGMWEQDGGMTAGLDARDRHRLSRSGVLPLSSDQGTALFDAALDLQRAVLVPARLDLASLRARPAAEPIPTLFHGLVRVRRAVAAGPAAAATAAGFDARLRELPPPARHRQALDLVRTHTAAVLGHSTAGAIEPDQAFKEMGFDSLTGVELRNQLRSSTGLRLTATLVFDHPTPATLATELVRLAVSDDEPPMVEIMRDLDRLEAATEAIEPGETGRGEVAKRLRRILWKLDARTGPAGDAADFPLGSATAAEVLAFIDSEFGDLTSRSGPHDRRSPRSDQCGE